MPRIFFFILLSVLGPTGKALAQSSTSDADSVDFKSTQRVTLHLKSAPPQAAFSTLAEKAGFSTELFMGGGGPLFPHPPLVIHDFDVDQEALVTTLWRMCALYHLQQQKNYGVDAMVFQEDLTRNYSFAAMRPADAAQQQQQVCITGPFGVVPKEITRDRWIDPLPVDSGNANGAAASSPPAQNRYQLQLMLLAEPRITVCSLPSAPTVDTMVDDQNESLWDAAATNQRQAVSFDNYDATSMLLPLRTPLASATEITSFAGSVQLHVVTRSHRYELVNLDRPGVRTEIFNGMRVTIHQLVDEMGGRSQEAIIDVDRNGQAVSNWDEMQALLGHASHIRIFDKAGNLLSDPFRWYEVTNGVNFQMSIIVSGNGTAGTPVGRAYRMTWDFPLESGDVTVPFSFSHLPLPRN